MLQGMVKEKLLGKLGSVSGIASIFGSWQVCHNICLGIIALLSVIGITVTGMPLFFLTKLAVPLWSIAFILLIITILIYIKKPCISGKLIVFNLGILTFGIPFQIFQPFSLYFRIVGGIIVFGVILFFLKNKFGGKK